MAYFCSAAYTKARNQNIAARNPLNRPQGCPKTPLTIYTWRRQALQQGVAPAFAPAVIIDEHPPTAPVPQQAAITIELSRGVRVSIAAHAPAALVTAALRALR
jgi:hypothetical protein